VLFAHAIVGSVASAGIVMGTRGCFVSRARGAHIVRKRMRNAIYITL